MTTKKAASKIPTGRPKVKMIQTIDKQPGQSRIYFSDGTSALTKKGSIVNDGMLDNPLTHAPNSVRVWTERGLVIYVEPLDTGTK